MAPSAKEIALAITKARRRASRPKKALGPGLAPRQPQKARWRAWLQQDCQQPLLRPAAGSRFPVHPVGIRQRISLREGPAGSCPPAFTIPYRKARLRIEIGLLGIVITWDPGISVDMRKRLHLNRSVNVEAQPGGCWIGPSGQSSGTSAGGSFHGLSTNAC
jgi:hypothetical protein